MEAARRRRIQQLEEQKRHSWAGCEEVKGSRYHTLANSATNFSTNKSLIVLTGGSSVKGASQQRCGHVSCGASIPQVRSPLTRRSSATFREPTTFPDHSVQLAVSGS